MGARGAWDRQRRDHFGSWTAGLDCHPQHEARGLPHLGARLGPFDDAEGLPVPSYSLGGLPLLGGGTAQGSPYVGVALGGARVSMATLNRVVVGVRGHTRSPVRLLGSPWWDWPLRRGRRRVPGGTFWVCRCFLRGWLPKVLSWVSGRAFFRTAAALARGPLPGEPGPLVRFWFRGRFWCFLRRVLALGAFSW